MELDMKYYFITVKVNRFIKNFTSENIYNEVIHEDPIAYIVDMNKKFNNEDWILLFYKEITKEEYLKYTGHF